MPLLTQYLADIFGSDDLAGARYHKFPNYPAELGVVMGPIVTLQQRQRFRICTQNLPGHVDVHVAQT